MILRSKAKIVEKDVIEGACRKGSQLQVFTASFDQHHWCMQHCQKLGGRSPPVTTLEEWETMVDELEAISSETFYDYMWTSATEGDKDGSSSKLSHWPLMEEVDGNSVPLESLEGVWRDYYTGQRLTDFEKPYDDAFFGEDYNCLEVHTDEPWSTSWNGIQCHTYENVCPCQYTQQPVLVLRGEFFGFRINSFSCPQVPVHTTVSTPSSPQSSRQGTRKTSSFLVIGRPLSSTITPEASG